jgi:hypothetical protein
MACSNLKALFRVDAPSTPVASEQSQFFSNGGFIEVMTRSQTEGLIDKSRLCTAYVEFLNNPADAPADLASLPVRMNVYTATHCLDYSKDHEIKMHLFDGSVYRDFWVDHKPLEAVKQLRVAMKKKGVAPELRKQVLDSLRTSSKSLNDLVNAESVSSGTTGTGGSNKAGELCLIKNDPDWQHVCATFQDLSVIQVEPSPDLPPIAVEQLKAIRAAAVNRSSKWIRESNLAIALNSANPPLIAFPDDKKALDLKSVHGEIRNRLRQYSQFKSIQFVSQELAPEFKKCSEGQDLKICQLNSELSAIVKAALEGNGYDRFEDKKLFYSLDILKSGYVAAQDKIKDAFNIFSPFLETNGQTTFVNVTARVHSNFRFVAVSQGTQDRPDPKDSVSTGRAFANFNLNNLTGDRTGKSVSFIRWVDSPSSPILARFNYFKLPRRITDAVRQNYESQIPRQVPYIGFMQAGDSGSIVVLEHMPYFAITSVDGEATSGGSALRPLPQPMEEADLEEAVKASGSVNKKSSSGCR